MPRRRSPAKTPATGPKPAEGPPDAGPAPKAPRSARTPRSPAKPKREAEGTSPLPPVKRDWHGRPVKGESLNPINRHRTAFHRIFMEEAYARREQIAQAVENLITRAAGGDHDAQKLLLDRILGATWRERPKEAIENEVADHQLHGLAAIRDMVLAPAPAKVPAKPTGDIVRRAAEAASAGVPFDAVADAVGIPPGTFNTWLKLGAKYLAESSPGKRDMRHAAYAHLVAAMRRGHALYRSALATGTGLTPDPTQLRLLERRDPEHFSRQGAGNPYRESPDTLEDLDDPLGDADGDDAGLARESRR